MIEKDFDVPFVAQLAQREKQIQQHYRPVIGVHKWFACRPGTLFRALLLAEFGGESGPRARLIKEKWATDIRDQCLATNIPFFFKQWGGVRKKRTGRVLQGRTWDEMPRQIEMVSREVNHALA